MRVRSIDATDLSLFHERHQSIPVVDGTIEYDESAFAAGHVKVDIHVLALLVPEAGAEHEMGVHFKD